MARGIAACAALVIGSLLGVGCAGGEAEPVAVGQSVPPSDVAAATQPPPTEDPAVREAIRLCHEWGGACLGPIEAGTYTTEMFRVPITYTVPDGWTNGEDLPGNFLLYPVGEPRYIGIFLNPRAPKPCDEAADPTVEPGPDAYTAWLVGHPGLSVSEPTDVEVGGLPGVWMDVDIAPDWDRTCEYSEGQPIVPVFIGDGVSDVHHVVMPGVNVRLYVLELGDGGMLLIELGFEEPQSDQNARQAWVALAQPVIDSLRFG